MAALTALPLRMGTKWVDRVMGLQTQKRWKSEGLDLTSRRRKSWWESRRRGYSPRWARGKGKAGSGRWRWTPSRQYKFRILSVTVPAILHRSLLAVGTTTILAIRAAHPHLANTDLDLISVFISPVGPSPCLREFDSRAEGTVRSQKELGRSIHRLTAGEVTSLLFQLQKCRKKERRRGGRGGRRGGGSDRRRERRKTVTGWWCTTRKRRIEGDLRAAEISEKGKRMGLWERERWRVERQAAEEEEVVVIDGRGDDGGGECR